MKLIRALAEKNKLARHIKDIQSRITNHNSYISGNDAIYNMDDQLKDLNQAIDNIVAVKTKIAKANLAVTESVFRLSELKSLAGFLKKLDIKEGKVKEETYNSTVNEWSCELSNVDRDKLVLDLESQIESLQMQMDKYNFETDV